MKCKKKLFMGVRDATERPKMINILQNLSTIEAWHIVYMLNMVSFYANVFFDHINVFF